MIPWKHWILFDMWCSLTFWFVAVNLLPAMFVHKPFTSNVTPSEVRVSQMLHDGQFFIQHQGRSVSYRVRLLVWTQFIDMNQGVVNISQCFRSSKRKQESLWVKKPLDELEKLYDPTWLKEKVVDKQKGGRHPQDQWLAVNFNQDADRIGLNAIYRCLCEYSSSLSSCPQHSQDPDNPKKMIYAVFVGGEEKKQSLNETGHKLSAAARISGNKAMRSSVVDVLTARAADSGPFQCVEDGGTNTNNKRRRGDGPGGEQPKKKELTEEQKQQKQFQMDCDKILICTRHASLWVSSIAFTITTGMLKSDLFHLPRPVIPWYLRIGKLAEKARNVALKITSTGINHQEAMQEVLRNQHDVCNTILKE